MSQRRAYRIAGRVQGVGFRWWAREIATELELRGTVHNAPDGTVRVEAAGAAAALERFEDRLRTGPPGARVRAVEQLPPASTPLPEGFEIVRHR